MVSSYAKRLKRNNKKTESSQWNPSKGGWPEVPSLGRRGFNDNVGFGILWYSRLVGISFLQPKIFGMLCGKVIWKNRILLLFMPFGPRLKQRNRIIFLSLRTLISYWGFGWNCITTRVWRWSAPKMLRHWQHRMKNRIYWFLGRA